MTPKQTVSDEEIVELLRSDIEPVWSHTELAEEIGLTRQATHRRLEKLPDEYEDIQKKEIGRSHVYYSDSTNSEKYGCPFCNYRFSLRSKFTEHIFDEHKNKLLSEGD